LPSHLKTCPGLVEWLLCHQSSGERRCGILISRVHRRSERNEAGQKGSMVNARPHPGLVTESLPRPRPSAGLRLRRMELTLLQCVAPVVGLATLAASNPFVVGFLAPAQSVSRPLPVGKSFSSLPKGLESHAAQVPGEMKNRFAGSLENLHLGWPSGHCATSRTARGGAAF